MSLDKSASKVPSQKFEVLSPKSEPVPYSPPWAFQLSLDLGFETIGGFVLWD